MRPAVRQAGFQGEILWELDIADKQLSALAQAIPAGKYTWRPDEKARSMSEVLIHVAAGNFMLLDAIGITVPTDLYLNGSSSGEDRAWTLIRRNDQMEKAILEKDQVCDILKRSIGAVRRAITEADEAEFNRGLHFFGEMTSVRRVFLRLIAHMHEHMGQLTGYLRMNGMPPPWPDWRPDRRA